MRGRNTFAVVLLLSILVTGCASSPGSFGARLTENGRLLQYGPQELMTSATISSERINDVAILYEFAIEANEIKPPPSVNTGGSSQTVFPATDIGSQQMALSRVATSGWMAITLVGEGRIDRHCTQFISALHALEKEKKATLANMNAIQSATVGIMGLALAAQKTIGITGISLGLAANLFDNTISTVLYQMPAQSITSIVLAQRDILRKNEEDALRRVTNQGMASARLAEYIRYCTPVTIEANIASVLGNAQASPDGKTIKTSDTQPAVTSSALATSITGIADTAIWNTVETATPWAPVKLPLTKAQKASLDGFNARINSLTDHGMLEKFVRRLGLSTQIDNWAKSDGVPVSQLDPVKLKKLITGTAYVHVEKSTDKQAEIAKWNKRLDTILSGG